MSKLNLMDSTYEILTTRQYAAIHLRVPDSGDAALDAMIRQANRMEFAKAVQCGMMAAPLLNDYGPGSMAKGSVVQADALLAALEAKL